MYLAEVRRALDQPQGPLELEGCGAAHGDKRRRLLIERFSPGLDGAQMRVQVYSFGYKHGSPHDVDLLFDVRHLPNPHFVAELRDLSGHDPRVVKFLNASDEVRETVRRFAELIDYLLPLYKREGKSYVTIGIGCTGGRHRSVMVANAIARHLRRAGYEASAVHRDVSKTKRQTAVSNKRRAKSK